MNKYNIVKVAVLINEISECLGYSWRELTSDMSRTGIISDQDAGAIKAVLLEIGE